MRSGMLTALVIAVIVALLAFAYRERGRGHLHKLEARIVTERQDAPVPRPGGQEALVLTRSRLAGGSVPEFLSVTMLPGRGMNILQITAFLPDKGEVGLLDSPAVEDAEKAMNGQGSDANGEASMAMGGAFEVPWAGPLWGAENEGHVALSWRGHSFSLPASGAATEGGLLLARPADTADTAAMPDGGQANASFASGDFSGHWPSKTDVKVTVLMTGRLIDLGVTAHNAGDVPEPVGIGWHPRFVVPGDRTQLHLRLPGEMRILKDRQGQPTGTLAPVAGTPYDFTAHSGTSLGTTSLDDTFVRLHQEFLDNGPITELTDPAGNYGLRMTALTATIQAIHVFARPDVKFIAIEPRFNYDDPFGREWSKEEDTGIVVLQPGQTAEWRIRLEIFALTGAPSPF